MKERERHLPDSCLWTLQEQTDHNESGSNQSFQPTLWLSSAVEVKATVLAKNSNYILFHCDLSAPAMSADMSRVVILMYLLLFYRSKFFFYIIIKLLSTPTFNMLKFCY